MNVTAAMCGVYGDSEARIDNGWPEVRARLAAADVGYRFFQETLDQ